MQDIIYLRRIKRVFLTLVLLNLITFSFITNAHTPPNDNLKCGCSSLLEETISKIELNYIAYHVEVKGKRDAEYKKRIAKFKKKAAKTSLNKCISLLQDFISYFRDGHLFIGQNPKLTDEQIANLAQNREKIERSEIDIKNYFAKNVKKLDPIEGIWYSSNKNRFAIFRDKKSKKRDFVAILLSENVKLWEKGQVKAEFTKLKDGSYNVVYYNSKHYPLNINIYERGAKGGARIRRGLILHMPPISWGKEYPASQNSLNQIDSTNPRKPILKVIDSENVIISIPSHVPTYTSVLKKLVGKHKKQIENAENLIIDLRGNEGGSSGMTNVLMPYIMTKEKHSPKYWVGDEAFVLSSERNLVYFKRAEKQGWAPKNLVKRLTENSGKMISFADPETDSTDQETNIKQTLKPKNVAILTDSAVVSAGEAFIIKAMKYKKVTLFGQPTGGVIDYQSTYLIGFKNCKNLGIYIGYPMFAASTRLPKGGVNKTGIIPNVQISKDEKRPVKYIVDYYKKMNRKKVERVIY